MQKYLNLHVTRCTFQSPKVLEVVGSDSVLIRTTIEAELVVGSRELAFHFLIRSSKANIEKH